MTGLANFLNFRIKDLDFLEQKLGELLVAAKHDLRPIWVLLTALSNLDCHTLLSGWIAVLLPPTCATGLIALSLCLLLLISLSIGLLATNIRLSLTCSGFFLDLFVLLFRVVYVALRLLFAAPGALRDAFSGIRDGA